MIRASMLVTVAAFGVAAFTNNTTLRAGDADPLHPRVKLETTLGDIVLELDAEKAPVSTMNFLLYVEEKFYDDTVFHRVMSNFMIQGGGFTSEMDKKVAGMHTAIKNEWKNGLKNDRGTISMARTSAPDSATSQFFINVVDNASLDTPRGGAAYAVFGKVVEGMDTVDKIRNTPVGTHPNYGSAATVPTTPVVVKTARLISKFDRNQAGESVLAASALAAKKAKESKSKEASVIQEMITAAEKESGNSSAKSATGLIHIDLKVGSGESPSRSNRVKVHYTGWLLDGTKFDSSVDRGKPSTFGVTQVIKGWTEALLTMKVGGKRKLIIPPDLAYGSRAKSSIPANSTLVFDVELLGIE